MTSTKPVSSTKHSFAKIGFTVLSLAILPLTGCASGTFGAGAGTSSSAQIADITQYSNYTADQTLLQARSHFREMDFGYSAAFYKRYVELTPNDPEGYIGLGASYDRLGRFDLSDRVYASLHRISGDTVQYYNNLGYSQMLRGNLSAALTNFRKAQAIDPDNMVVQNNLQLLADVSASRST